MKKIVLILVVALSFTTTSKAGFPIGQGRWLLVPTYTQYNASGYWDENRQSNLYSNGGSFRSNYFGLYGGYGIGRDVDLVFNLPYVNQIFTENNTVIEQLQTSADAMIGLKYFLNHYDYFKHLSITGSLLIPMYQAQNTQLLPGFGSPGIEVKLGLAGTNTTRLKDTYYDIEGGIRHYFNPGEPTQLFANATLGTPIGEDWKLSGTLSGVTSSASIPNQPINALVNRNFDYLRGTITLGRRIDRNISLNAAIFTDFLGRNIGQGRGFSIFAVIKF
jgi:protein XagA